MCTVTYIPTKDGFILSSNRDESPKRAYNPLVKELIGDTKVMYPKDSKGGSWLFASEKKEVVCVLNGAFVKHTHQPPYRESRGIIARMYFNFENPAQYIKNVDLIGIEPFTMIIASPLKLFELRWDGKVKFVEIKDLDKNHIWSSATLYEHQIQALREQWFRNYLQNSSEVTRKEVRYIHRNGTVGDPTQNYVMNRNDIVKTISISHVIVGQKSIEFEFENLVDDLKLNEQFYFTAKSIHLPE